MMDMESEIVRYAGRDYANPGKVAVEKLWILGAESFDELLRNLISFNERHAGLELVLEDANEDYASVTAMRPETPAETERRIEGYRQIVRNKEAKRRAEYERMKAEYGDG